MNPAKVDELDYIHFLVAAQKVFSTTEATRVRSGEETAPAHDAYTRLLQRMSPDSKALWTEVEPFINRAYAVERKTTCIRRFLAYPICGGQFLGFLLNCVSPDKENITRD